MSFFKDFAGKCQAMMLNFYLKKLAIINVDKAYPTHEIMFSILIFWFQSRFECLQSNIDLIYNTVKVESCIEPIQ